MSVLVKGMKKPKSCGECQFLVYSHYRPMCSVTKQIPIYQLSETLEQVLSKRMYGCPLVEVLDGQEEWLDGMDALYEEEEDGDKS